MVRRLQQTAVAVGLASAAVAISLAIGVSAARSTNRAELLLGALLVGAVCIIALARPWVSAVGLAPVFLLPYSAMSNQYPHGLHVVPLLALFVLTYGMAAWTVAR